MIRLITTIACFVLVLSFSAQSQVLNVGIIEGFKTGESESVSNEFAEEVVYTSPDESGTFKKDQATSKLKTFFSKCQPKDFKIVHTGSSPGGTSYHVAELHGEDEKYRVYLLHSTAESEIVEIRIEEDD